MRVRHAHAPKQDVKQEFILMIVVISEPDNPIDVSRSRNNKPNCCSTGKANSCKKKYKEKNFF